MPNTFKAEQKINKDEKLHHYLIQDQITQKFNIPKESPWGAGAGAIRTFN